MTKTFLLVVLGSLAAMAQTVTPPVFVPLHATLKSSSSVASGTYTSGITATGTIGQTCLLTALNGGGTAATASVALTGTNAISGGTALVITAAGSGYTAAPTSSTAGNGTATCSGTAVIATVLVPTTVTTPDYFACDIAGGCTYNLPAAQALPNVFQACFYQNTGRTGVITLRLPSATTMDKNGTAGTAAGSIASPGAGTDMLCVWTQGTGIYFAQRGTSWTPGS